MDLKSVFQVAQKFVTDNTPGILTGLGVAGTVTTAVLTGKASYSAALMIAEAKIPFERGDAEEPTKEELVKLVWKEFIPPAVVGVATVTAIIAANRVGSRRAAALAAAFKVSEKMAEEYKEKVVTTLGKQSEEKMRAKLAEEQMQRTPGRELVILSGKDTLFFDAFSGRYFNAEIEKVRRAVNEINFQVNNSFYASLTDFYDMLGLPRTEVSDEFGWNADALLEIVFTPVLAENDQPAISITFNKTPIRGYDRVQ